MNQFKNINMESLFDTFARSFLPDNKIHTLAAIWLDRSVAISTGEMKRRLEAGMKICVRDGMILNCCEDFPPTHEIKGCMGTINSSFLELILKNLETGLPENLQIK